MWFHLFTARVSNLTWLFNNLIWCFYAIILEMLKNGGDFATGLAQIDKVVADLKAATSVDAHQPAKAT